MKISKNIFICALLVLMLLVCVNAASAEETFNETLGADAVDAIAVDAAPVDELSANVEEIEGDAVSSADDGGEIVSASDADPELAAGSTIYVSTTGSDSNDGLSEANAVATINHAVDIADGKIVILAGEYTVTSLLNVTKDLEITGQGDVTIKSNSQYTIDVYDDYWEEWDTETHYTLINNTANLYLNNIKFTLVRATISDPLINNLGNLYVNTCEFNNIKISSGKGVIQNAKGAYLEVKDTTFKTASSTYGGINNNGELLVDGCKFLDNDRSSDSGVFSTAITSYNKATILNSEFENNKGTAGGAVYVMYSYTLKENPVMEIKNCTFTNNNAPGTSYTSGTGGAVKCSGKAVTLTIEDSTFTGNNAKNGGAVYAEGNVTIIRSTFHGNTASIGEDVYVASGSNTSVLGCTVDDSSYLWQADGGNLTIGEAPAELTNIVTQDNFYDFFDESGILLDTVPFDELIFQGEFSDLGAGYVIITKPIKITGDNAVLNNMGIVVSSGDVSINDLTLNADVALGDLVNVVESNVNLTNLNITYIVNDEAARAVSIIGAMDVIADNLKITYESHITDSSVDACAINIEESGNVAVTNSEINSSLPALLVNYDMSDSSLFMGLNQANPVRVVSSSNVNITKNKINSVTNDYSQMYATIQAMLILETSDCLVDSNNITLTDSFAQVDQDIYLYGISFAYDEGLVMSNNNFTVFTNGGKEAAGTAYAIQGIESDLAIVGNNITTFSNGPNLGIYVTSMAGEGSTMTIEKNFINVTGLAAAGNNWALVSGIEIQNGDAKVYNNTIYTYNVDEYDEDDYLSGISYIQYMYGGRTFDIQDNTVYTTGKYPIYLIDASNSIITGNTLYGHELTGDDAVYIQSGENNVVKDNLPAVEITEIYVSTTGDDAKDGSSEAKAVATIAHAIELAAAKGVNKIIILEGTHTLDAALSISTDLEIVGQGNAVIDGNSKRILENTANLNLTNLTFTNGKIGNSVIWNKGNTTIDGCTLYNLNTTGSTAAGPINNGAGTMIINNSKIYNSKGARGVIASQVGTKLIINNSEIYDNDCTSFTNSYGIVYGTSADIIAENTVFRNNKAKSGAGFYVTRSTSATTGSLEANNITFENNVANVGTGGAVFVSGNNIAVNINDSKFINNSAVASASNVGGYGAAIYLGSGTGKITVTKSIFVDNTANNPTYNDAGIYMGAGSLDISDSVILAKEGDSHYALQNDGATVTAENNWWGSNDTANTNANVEKIVKMDASFTPADAIAGQEVTVTATFDNVNLPDGINVTFTSTSGNLNTVVATVGGQASTTYTIDANDDNITATSGNAVINMTVAKPYEGIIYVNTTGNDNNEGSIDAPVASVAKAVELAQGKSGQIIIDQGAYEFDASVEINDDLNISTVGDVVLVGPGSTTVKAFVIRSGDVSISNLTFINFNASNYGAAIRVYSGSLTLDGIKFIKNGGEYRDALVYVRDADLTLTNSIFEDNTAHKTSTSYGTVSVGTGTLYMDNCNFTNNHNKYGCLYLSNIIATIYNSSFVGNNATSASAGTGAGIYVSGASTSQYSSGGTVFPGSASYVLVQNCNFINNTAFGAARYPGQGGAIYVNNNVTMFIVDSLFENNTALDGTNDKGQGGAIFASAGNVKITGSTFKNNNATQGTDIYMKYYTTYMVDPSGVNELNISDSIILNGDNSVVSDTTNGIYIANNNWWGTNDEPASKVSEGITVDTWAKMNATFTPADAKSGDEVTVTATFDNVNLPDGINVTFTSTSGALNTVVATVGGQATTTYTIDANDDAIIATSTDAVIEMPIIKPLANITVEDASAWIGTDATVTVNVPNATGTVTIEVNGKSYDVELVDGVATKDIAAEDLVAGENTVTATYNGPEFASTTATGVVNVIDGVVTQDNYMYYFNQDDNGRLFDYVPEGATLDFQGSIINPDQANTVQMNVNKPVNIITTTGDAYVDLNTTSGSLLGESPGNTFAITSGGSGSNVTGIAFHNTQLWISNTTNVVLDNISNVVENQRVGSGVGATTIRDNSTYVTLKNSYFYTKDNGGSTTFTFSWASYCTIDNCTVKAEGNVGNLIYLNTFNIAGAPTGVPLNNNNTVSNNKIYGKEGSGISVGLMVEGTGNLIINNTLYKSSISTSFGGSNPANNTYVGNTITEGGSLTALANSIVYSNNVTGAMTLGAGSVAYNNTVGGRLTASGAGVEAYNNTVGSLTVSQANAYIHDNVINGAVSLAANAANANFTKNNVTGTVTVAANAAVSITENNIITTGDYAVDLGAKNNKVVTDNLLIAKELDGDAAVKATGSNNTIENNRPVPAIITVAADNITVGQTAVINVTLEDGANGAVNLIVNGKSYTVDIVDGQGQVTVEGLTASDYTAAAYFETSDIYFKSSENSTVFNVAKLETAIAIDVINATLGEDAAVVVTIPNATGSVKIIINGVEHAVDLEDGQATYIIEDIAAGDYNVVAFYAGDKNNDAASNSTTFTVAKLTPEIVVDVPAVDYGSDALITIEIANATGNVFVDVGANKYYAELENGVATITVPKVTENATVTVKYAGDDNYDAGNATAELIVNKLATSLSGSDITVTYKEGTAWTVTLTDASGNAISGVAVNIGVNVGGVDKVYSRVTDADGAASLPLNLNPGTYAINATFDGNDIYQASFANATVTVDKAAPVLAGEDLTMTYKDGAWSVTLTGADGTPISGVAIKIGINTGNADVVYSRSTDANGVASLPINLAPGSYAVNATFDGNFYYESAFVSATVTVEKAVATISGEDLTMSYKDGSKYNVTVVGADGAALAGVVVKFTIGNSNYNIKTDANGVASLPINLAIGDYTISAVVDDAKYSSDSISNAISVENNLGISAADVNMTYKDGTAYEVQLVNGEGNPVALAGQIVKITVKTSTYNIKTDANGIAKLPINLLAGEYVLTAEYNGVEITNNVTVNKA